MIDDIYQELLLQISQVCPQCVRFESNWMESPTLENETTWDHAKPRCLQLDRWDVKSLRLVLSLELLSTR